AERVRGAQRRVGDPGGVEFAGRHAGTSAVVRRARRAAPGSPVTRAAASLPEMIAVGTPTPGVVPQPARTAFSVPLTRLRGRNGPVWAKVCAAENGVPAPWPCAAQSSG